MMVVKHQKVNQQWVMSQKVNQLSQHQNHQLKNHQPPAPEPLMR
jgi:hypothetical protein